MWSERTPPAGVGSATVPVWPPPTPRQRRIVRGVTPMISAADSQLIFLAIAFSSTSWVFIIRSTSRKGKVWFGSNPQLRLSG